MVVSTLQYLIRGKSVVLAFWSYRHLKNEIFNDKKILLRRNPSKKIDR